MTTYELIEELKLLDPTGQLEVRVANENHGWSIEIRSVYLHQGGQDGPGYRALQPAGKFVALDI